MALRSPKLTTRLPFSPIVLVGVLLTLIAGSVVILMYRTANAPVTVVSNVIPSPAITFASGNPTDYPTTSPSAEPVDLGPKTLTNLGDLGLYAATSDDPSPVITYYSAGTLTTGPYSGYTRIMAIYQPNDPSGPNTNVFATKDNNTYILDTATGATLNQEYPIFDAKKVTLAANLNTDLPAEIQLDGTYSLYQDGPALGNNTSENVFLTDFSSYTALPTFNGLKLYANTISLFEPGDLAANYYVGTTQVVAVDSAGVAMQYDLASTASINAYTTAKPAYDAAVKAYDNNPDTTNPYPTITNPGLGFTTGDITGASVYASYSQMKASACSSDLNTWVTKNIGASDLKKIGTEDGMDIYALVNSTHPLLNWIYTYTIGEDKPGDLADSAGNVLPIPTESQFAAKNPLLFVKDNWGRFDMLTQDYYQTTFGGCGKPVVYLYPTKPTNVTVKFTGSMNLTTDIPTYHNGWNVLAQPNGTLTDLQAQFTNCASFAKPAIGSEYAANACAKNTYPYLYWAGSGTNAPYPLHTDGWIVSQADLPTFLNTTLDSVGFTSKEKSDMLSYWLPELTSKNAPYYKIDFLQTAEMNRIAPMDVSPTPTSVFRLFLDWKPLTSMPAVLPQPEKLAHVQRSGFTLLEWGGLNR